MKALRQSASPFLKWAGGKRQLLPEIYPRIPIIKGRYIEPFMGAAAVFFSLAPKRSWLNDINDELVNCFCVVRDEVDELLKRLSNYYYDKDFYYEIRKLDRQEGGLLKLDPIERAARFIFLNRTGFNGLYRVNLKGHFNVPFGKYKNPEIANSGRLKACHDTLQNSKITQFHFRDVLSQVRQDDFVYLDPPYHPVSPTSNFTNYDKIGFGRDEQSELAEFLHYFNKKNILFLASNASHPLIYELYEGLSITEIPARRSINSKSEGRVSIPELLISNL
jgi:DNA adenine methylase